MKRCARKAFAAVALSGGLTLSLSGCGTNTGGPDSQTDSQDAEQATQEDRDSGSEASDDSTGLRGQ